MLKILDLFSGIGGFSLGLESTGGFETVGFCEINPYSRAVIQQHWPHIPIHWDVRTLEHAGPVDLICGGYPCQPFSTAGKRRGQEDDRHLWPAMFGLVEKHRPSWVIGENVAGHVTLGLDQMLADLEGAGYQARTFLIPAVSVDAPHRRDRVWTVAWDATGRSADTALSNAHRIGLDRLEADLCGGAGAGLAGEAVQLPFDGLRADRWADEPRIRRVADGVSYRMDRIKCLGNAIIPAVAREIGKAILAVEASKSQEIL